MSPLPCSSAGGAAAVSTEKDPAKCVIHVSRSHKDNQDCFARDIRCSLPRQPHCTVPQQAFPSPSTPSRRPRVCFSLAGRENIHQASCCRNLSRV
ncbi:hypothetical protein E2C01_102463 [Portunus trituberculatus]|uniref:Uncharacterized protein n=1 Tax=Portunus trituberculatus TaxID=210409 RepID=A0A5B7KMW5_PORTR|nr:hypothetical protein [Portunus trituberculatus]